MEAQTKKELTVGVGFVIFTVLISGVGAWTGEIHGRVVCDVCGDSAVGPEDHVLEGSQSGTWGGRQDKMGETSLHYVIIDIGTVGGIDTSGITMLEEVQKNVDRKGLKLVIANPRSKVIKKLAKSKFTEKIGKEWV